MTAGLPDFLVIGAMKAATTSLHHYLGAHPQLYLPETKELNYFRDERHFLQDSGRYRSHFAAAGTHQVLGEVSPDYTKHPHHSGAPERIRAVLPDVRLVYLLRHPIDRMRSMYLHQTAAGRERRPIDVALLQDPHYLEVSQYGMQLQRYLACFSRDQVLLCSSEQLLRDRATVLSSVHVFLGVTAQGDNGLADAGQWYRGADRRRRGTLARVAAELEPARRLFSRLPDPLRDRIRHRASRSINPEITRMTDETWAELVSRLRPDAELLARWAPEIVASWELADHPGREGGGTRSAEDSPQGEVGGGT